LSVPPGFLAIAVAVRGLDVGAFQIIVSVSGSLSFFMSDLFVPKVLGGRALVSGPFSEFWPPDALSFCNEALHYLTRSRPLDNQNTTATLFLCHDAAFFASTESDCHSVPDSEVNRGIASDAMRCASTTDPLVLNGLGALLILYVSLPGTGCRRLFAESGPLADRFFDMFENFLFA